jgi:hypothetical protein
MAVAKRTSVPRGTSGGPAGSFFPIHQPFATGFLGGREHAAARDDRT